MPTLTKTSVLATLSERVPEFWTALRRFPVPALAAVLLWAVFNARIGAMHSIDDVQVVTAATAAFLAGGAAHLFAEARQWRALPNTGLAVLAALAAALPVAFSGAAETSLFHLVLGLCLLPLFTPYLRPGTSGGALWMFAHQLILAAALAVVVGIVLGLSISAVFLGLEFLFGLGIPDVLYARIWLFVTVLAGPLFGLSLVPRDLNQEVNPAESEGGPLVQRSIALLVNYILVPLALIYAVLLHAYAIKIAVTQTLPKGEVATMVSLFTLGGTLTWLMGWPWRDTGTPQLRLFAKVWFWMLPVPAILLAIAIARRVADYGWTPDRYGITLIAVWTAVLFLYLLWRRAEADIRFVTGSMAALLLLGALGPWGVNGVTARSQHSRLVAILEASGALKDGVLTGTPTIASVKDRQSAATAIDAIANTGAIEPLAALCGARCPATDPAKTADSQQYYAAANLKEALGISQAYASVDSVSFRATAPMDLRVATGMRIIGPYNVGGASSAPGVRASKEDGGVRVTVGARTGRLPFAALAQRLTEAPRSPEGQQQPVAIELAPSLTIHVIEAYGTTTDIYNIQFFIVTPDQP